MRFNDHSKLRDMHSVLSPSSPAWLNYDENKMVARYLSLRAAARGTKLHAIAHDLITEKINLPDTKKTIHQYVNDAIGFKMTSEQTLFYSPNCFGTADTIAYRQNTLRIHDLKTGTSKVSFGQLLIYAAIFFLEYEKLQVKPYETHVVLRIYQNNTFAEYVVEDMGEIVQIMSKIVMLDAIITREREEEIS